MKCQIEVWKRGKLIKCGRVAKWRHGLYKKNMCTRCKETTLPNEARYIEPIKVKRCKK